MKETQTTVLWGVWSRWISLFQDHICFRCRAKTAANRILKLSLSQMFIMYSECVRYTVGVNKKWWPKAARGSCYSHWGVNSHIGPTGTIFILQHCRHHISWSAAGNLSFQFLGWIWRYFAAEEADIGREVLYAQFIPGADIQTTVHTHSHLRAM